MQITELEIENFRGIKSFKKSFYGKKLICLIGRGDSGKSTILDAILYALYPLWNLTITDNDFFEGNTENKIIIMVSVLCPEEFIPEDKFGLYIRGLNKTTKEINNELNDNDEKVLTIRLEIDNELEPKWYVYKPTCEEMFKPISHKDRAKFNCFMISDYLDKHFTWAAGSPLYSIAKKDLNMSEYNTKFINPIRDAIKDINKNKFEDLNECFHENVQLTSYNIDNAKTQMEFKDIAYNTNKLSLHDENNIPFRLKGKGSKRLLSIAIQMTTANTSTITLIDEIEQGLEPDRVKQLVAQLKKDTTERDNQTFITTHSDKVITELGAENIVIIRKNEANSIGKDIPSVVNGTVRSCPEAFFAKKVIVCEGATEIGLCRAINNYFARKNLPTLDYYGVVFVDAKGGNNIILRSFAFASLGFETLLFCDSDVEDINKRKEIAKSKGIVLCDTEDGNNIESQIFKDIHFDTLKKLVELKISEKYCENKNNFITAMQKAIEDFSEDSIAKDKTEYRKALGQIANSNDWFKNVGDAEKLGNIIIEDLTIIPETSCIRKQLENIINWATT